MNSSDRIAPIDVYLWVMFVMIGFAAGMSFQDSKMKKESVKHGYAEFYLDGNHDKQWRWKDCNVASH